MVKLAASADRTKSLTGAKNALSSAEVALFCQKMFIDSPSFPVEKNTDLADLAVSRKPSNHLLRATFVGKKPRVVSKDGAAHWS